jgi:hypothetical protein
MRFFFTLLVILLALHPLLAQERTISGRLTSSEDGSPLPGVSITIKGTNVGTATDADGYYSIQVPIGATLVFSFIGMQTREVVVTENNLQPVKASKKQASAKRKTKSNDVRIPKSLYHDTTTQKIRGVAVLTDETPSYKPGIALDPSTIRSIKRVGNTYSIRSDNDPIKRTGFGLLFTSSLGIEKVNQLPSLQHQYAQGQPSAGSFQWRGADQHEIFSWGPLLRTLEFDGSSYPFDKNGRLVPAGTGNGKAAKNYDAVSFFRTGLTTANELMLKLPAPKGGTFIVDLENRSRTGVIPNSNYKRQNFSTHLKNYKLSKHIRANTSISFNRSRGDLLNRGANSTAIMGSVYRTPATFDNANGLSASSARSAQESYQLADGTRRSHAPAAVDNPFGLVNELPDHEKLHWLMASLNLQYDPTEPWSVTFNGSIDRQWSTTIFGIPVGYAGYPDGRLTQRKDNQTFANVVVTPSYRYDHGSGELKVGISYQAQYAGRQLNRVDGFNFSNNLNLEQADSIRSIRRNPGRTSHEVIFNTHYRYADWFNVRFVARNYFSNTVSANQYTNLFPTGSVSVDFAELLYLWPVEDLNVYGSVSRTIREASLLYSNWSYGATRIPVERYNSFYETNELFFTAGLVPETERKIETGLKFRGFNNRFTVELTYFNNRTADFIAPVWTTGGFALRNAAAIKNYGAAITAGYYGRLQNGSWGTDLKWGRHNSIVQQIYSADHWIPMAGFESIQSVLAPGKPVGAIYGSSYARNSDGKKIIGDDGFPLEDTSLKMIGNPIPDWTLGWSSFIQWKQLKFSFLLDFRKGGEVWNGTNAALDYLGRSSSTGHLRNTANYIFEGVDINGNPNTIPVSFSDPDNAISKNRWVRYGWDGIGEDHIEDASWIRLNELVLSYTMKRNRDRATIKEVKFSLVGRNLLLITPYSGADPSANLFGSGTGNGLDLFNTPSTRSYNAQITIKI